MSTLITLLNECFQKNSKWNFQAIRDRTGERVTIDIEYDGDTKKLVSSDNWNKNDLRNIYWEANLIESEAEKEIFNWIHKLEKQQKVKGLAPDTNLVIPGFISKILRKLPTNMNIPILVLFARSIQYEIHTMRAHTYSRREIDPLKEVLTQLIEENSQIPRLMNFHQGEIGANISGLSNNRGRIGLKGSYEIDMLHKWAPVIIVKPAHILHSPKVLESTTFLNAVHDSLIRYEIDYIRQNTSLPLLFLTNDKDQCKAADQEGIDTLFIDRPFLHGNFNHSISKNLDIDNIKRLILSLLTYSPILKMSSEHGTILLTWTWRNRNVEDISDHKIKIVDLYGNYRKISP